MPEWIITAQPGAEDEVYEFLDPKTRRTITLPHKVNGVDLKVLHEGIIEKSNTSAREKFKAQIEELTAKTADYDEIKIRLSDMETSGLSAADKAKRENEKILKDAQQAKADAERYKSSLHSERVKSAVFQELGKTKGLVDINKAATIFNAECKPKLVERNGEFYTVAEFDGAELDIAEAHAKWIARDDNKFLLQNTLSAGAGSAGGQSGIQGRQISRDQWNQMSEGDRDASLKSGAKIV